MKDRPANHLSGKAAFAVAVGFSIFLYLSVNARENIPARIILVLVYAGGIALIGYQFLRLLLGTLSTLGAFRAVKRIALCLNDGRVDEACALSSRSLEKYPREPVVRLYAASAFYRAGRHEEARRVFENPCTRNAGESLISQADHEGGRAGKKDCRQKTQKRQSWAEDSILLLCPRSYPYNPPG